MRIFRITKKVGLFTILIKLSFGIFMVFFSSSLTYAKTEVFFSPGGSIREALIKTIISSRDSIDIAAFTFTAGEIAEALYKAKENGAEIRVVIDQRQDEKHYPVIEFLKEEGFKLQFLKGKIGGSMNNTFAIFDGKLVVTGSYNWTEYADKFNYENALFIDDKDVIEKYREEFESLYNEGVMQGALRLEKLASSEPGTGQKKVSRAVAVDSVSETGNLNNIESKEKINEESAGNTVTQVAGKGNEQAKKHEENKQGNTTSDSNKQFTDISFIEFDKIFNSESKLDKSEKIRLWKEKYEGKYVRWTGKISFKGIAVYDWNKVVISHKGDDSDVNLKFDWSKQKKVMKLKVGDIVTYTGKLVSLNSMFSSYRLEDVDVVQVR